MIDAFVRVYAPNELRLGMAIATVSRWKMQPDVRLVVIECTKSLGYKWGVDTLRVPDAPFATASVETIEKLARSEVYAFSDDDMLIYGRDFVSKAIALLDKYRDYGLISASPTNEGGNPVASDELIESHSVGGAGVIRRGLITEFPSMENQFWSGEIHRQMQAKGFKQGYARDLKYLHMGSKYSISSPAHWVGV